MITGNGGRGISFVITASILALGAGPRATHAAAAETQSDGGAAGTSARLSVLFLGNSFTRYNGMTVLLEEFAAASTPPCELLTTLHIVGATSLQGHWERWPPAPFWVESKDPRDLHILSWIRGDTGHMAERLALNLEQWKTAPYFNMPMSDFEQRRVEAIAAGPWRFRQYRDAVARAVLAGKRPDCVVLQTYGEQNDVEWFSRFAGLYVPIARKAGARPLIYVPHDGFIMPVPPENRQVEDAKLDRVNAACLRVALELDVDLAPTYLACYKVKKERPEIALDFENYGDKHHSGPKCAYLIACVIYSTLFNRSPEGLPQRAVFHEIYDGGGAQGYEQQTGSKPPATVVLSDDEALYMQSTAWRAEREFREAVARAKADGDLPDAPAGNWVLAIGGPTLDAYRSALSARIRNSLGCRLVFAPFGESEAKRAAAELDDWMGGAPWRAVILGCGGRELLSGTPTDRYAADLEALAQGLKAKNTPVVWTQCLPLDAKSGQIFLAEVDPMPYNEAAADVMNEFAFPGVPIYQIASEAVEEMGEETAAPPDTPGDPPRIDVIPLMSARVWEALAKAVSDAVETAIKAEARQFLFSPKNPSAPPRTRSGN